MLGGSSGSASRAAIKKALLAIQLTRRAGEHGEQRRDSREERPEELPQRSRSGAGPTLPAIKAGRRMLHPRPEAGAAGVDASALPSNTEGGIFRGSSVGEKMRKRERLKRGVSQGESGEVELGMVSKDPSTYELPIWKGLLDIYLGLAARCAQGSHCQGEWRTITIF